MVAIHRDAGSEIPSKIAPLSIRPVCIAWARSGERSTNAAPDRQTVISPDFQSGPMRRRRLTRRSSGTARTPTWTEVPGPPITGRGRFAWFEHLGPPHTLDGRVRVNTPHFADGPSAAVASFPDCGESHSHGSRAALTELLATAHLSVHQGVCPQVGMLPAGVSKEPERGTDPAGENGRGW